MQLKSSRITGFIDLGTNSVRLLVVRLHPNGSYSVLTEQKETVRLGEGEYLEHKLTEQAMERTVRVIVHLVELAKSRGVTEFIAVATSAAREATNGEELCVRIAEMTGVTFHVISGTEEARLIWLGVSSAIDIRDEKALFIDIGGGSTEIIVGDQYEPVLLRSLKLGAIRTTGTFLEVEHDGRVTADSITGLRRHIESHIIHISRFLHKLNVKKAYGSSGTILSLESVAGNYKPCSAHHVPGFLKTSELEIIVPYLASLPIQVRREVQGLNPDRADIIVAGAIILCEILKNAGIKGIYTSSRSLRDGLLVDYISRIPGFPHAEQVSVRERSVTLLGRSCHIDEEHAGHIVHLSLMLFDSGKKAGLFKISDNTKELLKYAAYLHDVGQFISFTSHHQHSFYLITETSLTGFNQHEILIIALIARYHRKKIPKSRDLPFGDLCRTDKRTVRVLAMLLRLAENLDRSHDRRVEKAEFSRTGDEITLDISCVQDCLLERWAVEAEKESFFRTFRIPLVVTAHNS